MMRAVKLVCLAVVIGVLSSPVMAQGSAKVVKVSLGDSVYKVKRGGSTPVAVIVEVDHGYHINSNRPAEKYLIATALKIERTPGITTTPVIYPKAKLERFEFSKMKLSVFEGKVVLKLNARALPSIAAGAHALKGKLTVQACNNRECLRPQTIDVRIPLRVD